MVVYWDVLFFFLLGKIDLCELLILFCMLKHMLRWDILPFTGIKHRLIVKLTTTTECTLFLYTYLQMVDECDHLWYVITMIIYPLSIICKAKLVLYFFQFPHKEVRLRMFISSSDKSERN